jgi:hypothetical protein
MNRSTLFFAALACTLAVSACAPKTAPVTSAPVVTAPVAPAPAPTTATKVATAVSKGAALLQTLCTDAQTGEVFINIFDPSLIHANKGTVNIANASCALVGAVAAANAPVTTAAAPPATP